MRNRAIISLENIRQNAIKVRKLIGDKLFCAVVKDDGYGHGGVEVASCLYSIVDSYAVALIEEGISLRLAGIDKDILVLIPVLTLDLERAIYYDLTLSVFSLSQIEEINEFAKRQNKRVKVHIQFDSGMNRCGTNNLAIIRQICTFITKSRFVVLDGIYSHYASPDRKRKTKKQVDKFLLAIMVAKGYNKNIKTHISASGGIVSSDNFDMVRVGLMLYGYPPKGCQISLRKAMRVEISVVKQITLTPFNCALYGLKRTYTRRNLALVRLGYGDGLSRKNVKGQFSTKCMDLCLVDMKEINNGYYVISDFEKEAKKYHTISYEIMVNISKRCEKIYKDS